MGTKFTSASLPVVIIEVGRRAIKVQEWKHGKKFNKNTLANISCFKNRDCVCYLKHIYLERDE